MNKRYDKLQCALSGLLHREFRLQLSDQVHDQLRDLLICQFDIRNIHTCSNGIGGWLDGHTSRKMRR